MVSVIDHGPGISDEQAAKIFDRFVRLDQSRNRDHGGSGLGLAIVAAIVAAHRGRIRYRAYPGGWRHLLGLAPTQAPPGRGGRASGCQRELMVSGSKGVRRRAPRQPSHGRMRSVPGPESKDAASGDAISPESRRWGPYLSMRQWGSVREDYSEDGDAWAYLPYEQARSRAYRWGEDGILGICDEEQRVCLGAGAMERRRPDHC